MTKFNAVTIDSDAFASLSPTRWTAGAGVEVKEGRLRINPSAAYPALTSKATYPLAQKIVTFEVPTTTGTDFHLETFLRFEIDANNLLKIGKSASNFLWEHKVGGVVTTGTVAFSAAAMKWWRIRIEGVKVFFETSPDGATWTTRKEVAATTLSLTAKAKVKVESGFWATPVEANFTTKFSELDAFSLVEMEPVLSKVSEKAGVGILRKWLRSGAVAHQLRAAGPALGSARWQTATALNTPITRPDDIFVTQWWQTKRIAEAKALGSTVLIYLNATRAAAPDGEGRHSTGLTLAEAEAIGAATAQIDTDAGHICLPNHGSYAQLWLERAIALAEAADADGVHLDDMNVYSDGATATLTEAEWKAQMQAFNEHVGAGLAAAGLLAIPNMSGTVGQRNLESAGWLEAQFAFYDGGFDEFFATWPSGTIMTTAYIEEAMKVMARQTAQGKLYIAGVNGSEAQIRYATALAMLQQQFPGKALVFASPSGPDYSRQSWTPDLEHALSLGVAIDTAKRGERRYSKGSVTGNVGASTGAITPA